MCPVRKLPLHHQPLARPNKCPPPPAISLSLPMFLLLMCWNQTVLTWCEVENSRRNTQACLQTWTRLTLRHSVCAQRRVRTRFVIVIQACRYCGSKVASLSILPFSLLVLYWEVSLLICDNVAEPRWGAGGIKAAIGQRWQGWTALLSGINSWRCSHVRQSLRPPTQWVSKKGQGCTPVLPQQFCQL